MIFEKIYNAHLLHIFGNILVWLIFPKAFSLPISFLSFELKQCLFSHSSGKLQVYPGVSRALLSLKVLRKNPFLTPSFQELLAFLDL
jgi:hypothetical protein